MRVLHVTRDFPPPGNGGLSTAVGGLVAASVGAGVDCAVVSFDGYRPVARPAVDGPPRECRVGGAHVLRVASPSQLDAAGRSARDLAPAVVHVHDGMLWDFAAGVARASGARTVLTVHVAQAVQDRLRGVARETLSAAAQRTAIAAADTVVAPSHGVADDLLADHPNLAPRLRVAGMGCEDTPAARVAAAHPERRAGGPVLFAGRLADVKGIDDFLALVPVVLAARPGVAFMVAGGLPENPKAERRRRRRFEEQAPAPVREAVRFTGWLPPADVSSLMAHAAVLVVPSWYETFGQVVLEGMLHGAPIVATRAGGVPELVGHEESGLLCAPRDVDALAAAVLRLLDDADLALRLGRAAAEHARARTWDRVLPSWHALDEAPSTD